jgi:hypothetical protein
MGGYLFVLVGGLAMTAAFAGARHLADEVLMATGQNSAERERGRGEGQKEEDGCSSRRG